MRANAEERRLRQKQAGMLMLKRDAWCFTGGAVAVQKRTRCYKFANQTLKKRCWHSPQTFNSTTGSRSGVWWWWNERKAFILLNERGEDDMICSFIYVYHISTARCYFSLFYHCSWFSPLQTLAFYVVNAATRKVVDHWHIERTLLISEHSPLPLSKCHLSMSCLFQNAICLVFP